MVLLFCVTVVFAQNIYSENGNSFTPKGDLKILLLCITFDNFDTIDSENWPAGANFPNWLSNNNFIFHSLSDFDTVSMENTSISNYYYQMSNHRFRMIEECL